VTIEAIAFALCWNLDGHGHVTGRPEKWLDVRRRASRRARTNAVI
jgi:hypothetical protein